MPEFKGRCRCGKVTYQASGDPIFAGLCHCKDCQKSTGTAFASVLALPADAVKVSGTLTTFDAVGDSGKATHRGFCPSCGATITEWADIMPGVMMLPVGSLDDPSMVKPAMQIFCDSAQGWAIVPDLPQFAKMPGPG